MKYRRIEQEKGRGQDITSINSIEGLQELFLELVSSEQVQLLQNKITELKMSIEEGYNKLYQMHQKDKSKRFMYLVNVL